MANRSWSSSNSETGDVPNAATHLRNFLRPCALLLLDEQPACGYELHDRLTPFSGGSWDHGAVYRVLNTMEEDGLVFSTWERSTSGPQRRRYRLTEEGHAALRGCANQLDAVRILLSGFLHRYEGGQGADEATLMGSRQRDSSGTSGESPAFAGLARPSNGHDNSRAGLV